MKSMSLTWAFLGLLLMGCDNSTTQAPTDPSPTVEATMNIQDGKAHYLDVLGKIRAAVQCNGKPLAWTEDHPEDISGTGDADGDETYDHYIYRSALYVAPVACHGTDFTTAVEAVTAILRANGGIKDDVVLDGDSDSAQGGYLKWLDTHGATWSFGSDEQTVLSVTSGPLDPD